ncbi:sugar ABC transporter ATP-binding protein [Actinospica durhamensis]|uniref:Sugar ABC transporter ATP-binding protein n=1 Tax=Actinospica durhamensis TaxID=1508375 RepID=A0A941ITG4_9ACTN|nr:sugar ABC transporter ATP-binding protein [Actinospica durhamensis]MBR7837597.1 sugar ABC transporter ATP-binding protein [Actinospica durhamensis]
MTAVLTPAVAARGIHKSYGSTRALRGVDVTLAPGRCLGLVGRNGAGKSTLVSILSGLQRPDEGEVTFDGEAAPPAGAVHAWRAKLATVHQHSMIVPELTVAENVFLGRLPRRRRRVDWRAVRTEAAAVLGEWGSGVDPARACRDLSVEQRQIVELARAVASGTKVLLLDEPTAALEREAVLRLFTRVRQLVDAGVAVLYISHHLEEVFDICDDVAVLRDGELVLTAPTAGLSTDGLVNAMVHGHVGGPTETELADQASRTAVEDLPVHVESADAAAGRPVLELRGLTAASEYGDLDGVSLTVAPGESVGVVGLISSGVVTLGRIAAGIESGDEGELLVGGAGLPGGDRAAALEAGVGYVPEDRRTAGYVGALSVAENMTMSITDRLSAGRLGVLGRRRMHEAAQPWADSLALVASSLAQQVADLSGGNQQKVTVARALARDPRLVVAITPTRGVDVVSKELLLQALRRAVDAGAGLLLATDELDDLGYCDRVLVLVRGRIVAEVPGGGRFDRTAMIAAIEGVASTIGSIGAGRGATSEEPGETP